MPVVAVVEPDGCARHSGRFAAFYSAWESHKTTCADYPSQTRLGCIVLHAHLAGPSNHNPVQRLPMPLREWLPDVTVTHCTSGHASRTPRSVRLMKRQMFHSLLLRRSCRDRQGTHCSISAASSSISSPALLPALASHSPAPSAKGHRRPSFGLAGLDPAG